MSVQDDDVQGIALSAVLGIVGLVLAGLFALVMWRSTLVAPADAATQRVYFAADGESLSSNASEALARLAEVVRADPQRVLVIHGVIGPRGDGAQAQRRALRVRHALEADGVAGSQLILSKPLPVRVPVGSKDAHRVDVRLE